MLLVLEKIQELSSYLDQYLVKGIVLDYRIILEITMDIILHIKVKKKGIIDYSTFKDYEERLKIHEITEDEVEEDQYYKWLFEQQTSKINLAARRRLNNFIDFIDKEDSLSPHPIITTFYSYKGGVGRSTALAAFASYCAIHHEKRVVILDCDFEAPGFTNFFDLNEEILSQKSGIVEYLLDKEFIKSMSTKLDIQANYSYKVGYEYIGNGQIFIIPAGNLSNEIAVNVSKFDENSAEIEDERSMKIHRDHYLEALARIDITSINNIVEQFREFLQDVQQQLQPDIILIDARTGFNDIFALLARLSHVIVGFFGNNIQNKPGIELFVNTFGKINSHKSIILVNSIISGLEYFEDFKENIDEYINRNEIHFVDEEHGKKQFKMHYILRDERLSKIGTRQVARRKGIEQEYDFNFVDIIKRNQHFKELFEDIWNSIRSSELVTEINENHAGESGLCKNEKEEIINFEITNQPLGSLLEEYKNKVEIYSLRKKILTILSGKIPRRYADDEIPEIKDFYFRDCMKDMFNRDKFLIIGSKGTGKTFLYQAFRKDVLRKRLQERANVSGEKFLFINIISIHKEEGADKYLETTKFNIPSLTDSDFFFERFWVIYIWNAIMIELRNMGSSYYSEILPIEPINQTPSTVERFEKYIKDDALYKQIFGELQSIDDKLKHDNRHLLILFDQLDYVVKPEYWSKGIAPLINFWRTNPFSKILPKIFVRSDLFNKLSGITNIQNLRDRAINIEWNKEELFAYFFKIVLTYIKKEFFLFMYANQNYTENAKKFILALEEKAGEDNQVPLEEASLKPLVQIFFGKYADSKDINNSDRFGESYDWFGKNLQDANGLISIRPFLDLLEKAIELFLKQARDNFFYNKDPNTILSAYYYFHSDPREYAVDRYFTDLAKDEGNQALLKIHQYIAIDGPARFKIYHYRRNEFNEMLKNVLKYYSEDSSLKGKTVEDLKNLLISNGIIKEWETANRKYTNYSMPFLYRKYFRVHNFRRQL